MRVLGYGTYVENMMETSLYVAPYSILVVFVEHVRIYNPRDVMCTKIGGAYCFILLLSYACVFMDISGLYFSYACLTSSKRGRLLDFDRF